MLVDFGTKKLTINSQVDVGISLRLCGFEPSRREETVLNIKVSLFARLQFSQITLLAVHTAWPPTLSEAPLTSYNFNLLHI